MLFESLLLSQEFERRYEELGQREKIEEDNANLIEVLSSLHHLIEHCANYDEADPDHEYYMRLLNSTAATFKILQDKYITTRAE